jgi:hypothetical protein
MTTSALKELPLARIEEAFSKALSELAGHDYLVVLHGLRFETCPMGASAGEDMAAFSGQIEDNGAAADDELLAALSWTPGLLN